MGDIVNLDDVIRKEMERNNVTTEEATVPSKALNDLANAMR